MPFYKHYQKTEFLIPSRTENFMRMKAVSSLVLDKYNLP